MSTRAPIDAPSYLRMFPIDVPGTIALIIKLIGAVPQSTATEDEDELRRILAPANALRNSGLTLQQAWKRREEQATTKLRPIDIDWDAAWGALLARLEPWSIFKAVREHSIMAESAEKIISLIFPKRLDFTRLELNAQWVAGNKRLEWIAEHGLRDDLVKLVSAPFVERVEQVHERLGRALGLIGDGPDPDLPLVLDVQTAKLRAHDAIIAYTLQLIAADASASDRISSQIRASLAIFDEFRARARSRRKKSQTEGTNEQAGSEENENIEVTDDTVDFDTPIPPVPGS